MTDLFGNDDSFLDDGESSDELDDDFVSSDLSENEGVLPPRAVAKIIGQADAEARLISMLASGRMPHAIAFVGPQGVGKSCTAYALARSIFKKGVAGQDSLDVDVHDPVFRRVASGGHSDLLTVERHWDEEKNRARDVLDVEQIRKISNFARMTAAEGGWRVVIIDDADYMTRAAQNALLKILEEPPKQTLLILIAHRSGLLLPTIRSRLQIVRFQSLPPDQIHMFLQRAGANPTQRDIITALCEGSVGMALNMLQQGGVEEIERALSLLESAPNMDWPALHAYAEEIGRKGQESGFAMFSTYLNKALHACIAASVSGQSLDRSIPGYGFLQRLMASVSGSDLIDRADTLKMMLNRLNYANLDRRQGALSAFQIVAGSL
jgi:DNA polymerase-3 subunit delta'